MQFQSNCAESLHFSAFIIIIVVEHTYTGATENTI